MAKMKVVIVAALLIATLFHPAPLALAGADCASNPTAAGCPCSGSSSTVCNDLSKTSGGSKSSLASIINGFIKTALIGIGSLAVIMLIYGGIKYITSSGSKDNILLAKKVIIYAIAGLLLAVSAYAIVKFITGKL